MTKDTFVKGPLLTVIASMQEGYLRILLEEGPCFSLHCQDSIDPSLQQHLRLWMQSYGEKRDLPSFFLPRKKLPPFSERVYFWLEKTPFGQTLSYQELAGKAGNRGAARAVGTLCKNNPLPLLFPCHRVIHANGPLWQFAFGTSIKEQLLRFEGVI